MPFNILVLYIFVITKIFQLLSNAYAPTVNKWTIHIRIKKKSTDVSNIIGRILLVCETLGNNNMSV